VHGVPQRAVEDKVSKAGCGIRRDGGSNIYIFIDPPAGVVTATNSRDPIVVADVFIDS
jgi:hypothetical protein